MGRDELTGLNYFDDFIRIAGDLVRKNEKKYYITSVDFSNFKYINKLYGFEKGNILLQELARHVSIENEYCYVACRPYSDHIIGLFGWEGSDEGKVQEYVRTLNHEFVKIHKKNYPLVGFHLNIGVCPVVDITENITSIVDKSNIARRSMKGNYGATCTIYSEKLMQKTEEEALVIPLFEKALSEETIQVFLQPKISASKQALVGAEALARLFDENGTVVMPAVFIPVLEKSGRIVELDLYVLEYVLRMQREWFDEGKVMIPISVNLSQLHFYNSQLVEEILFLTNKYGVDPQYIEFEVTETVFISETELITEKLEKLRTFGYRVSVDDFGAGYSSLNLIGILPVDIIKLDKAFIKNSLKTERGNEIIKGLIEILNRLNMNVICEGIENKEDEKIINDYGCDEVQGFLYDRPLPHLEFEKKYM